MTTGNNCTISGSGNGTIPPSPVSSPSGSVYAWAATNPPATVTTYAVWCLGIDGTTHSNISTATVNIAACNPPSYIDQSSGQCVTCMAPNTIVNGICTGPNYCQQYPSSLQCFCPTHLSDPSCTTFCQQNPTICKKKPKFIEF
jgi:hypothetical protein